LNLLKPVVTAGLTAGLVALCLTTITAKADHDSAHSIATRIGKVGTVCVDGGECKAPVAAVAVVASGPRSGEDVYNAACAGCHNSGAAGAPKFADATAWSPRISKGIDMLVSNAINGIGAMPARGLCMDCSDDEIRVTVEYMVDATK